MMAEQPRERWRELCELAIIEHDPIRLTQLFHEIEELLSDVSLDDDQEVQATTPAGVDHATAIDQQVAADEQNTLPPVSSLEVESGPR